MKSIIPGRRSAGLFLGQDPEVSELDLGAVVLEEDRAGLRTLGLPGAGLVLELGGIERAA